MMYIVPIVTRQVTRGGRDLTFNDPAYRELFGPICTRVGKTDTHMTCIAQLVPGGPAVRAQYHDELVGSPGVTFVED